MLFQWSYKAEENQDGGRASSYLPCYEATLEDARFKETRDEVHGRKKIQDLASNQDEYSGSAKEEREGYLLWEEIEEAKLYY